MLYEALTRWIPIARGYLAKYDLNNTLGASEEHDKKPVLTYGKFSSTSEISKDESD